jgi:hypothetical protein
MGARWQGKTAGAKMTEDRRLAIESPSSVCGNPPVRIGLPSIFSDDLTDFHLLSHSAMLQGGWALNGPTPLTLSPPACGRMAGKKPDLSFRLHLKLKRIDPAQNKSPPYNLLILATF